MGFVVAETYTHTHSDTEKIRQKQQKQQMETMAVSSNIAIFMIYLI